MPFAPWANGAARWPAASCVGQPPAGKGGERRQASGAGDGGGQASGAGDGGGRRREREAGTASGGKREAGTARNNSYFEKKKLVRSSTDIIRLASSFISFWAELQKPEDMEELEAGGLARAPSGLRDESASSSSCEYFFYF